MDDPFGGETAISNSEEGLRYRGYSIQDLADESSFIETAYLLLEGELPSQEHLADFRALLGDLADVDVSIIDFIEEIPLHVPQIDVLRTTVSMLANFDPQPDETGPATNLDKARRLLAQLPVLIAARQRHMLGLPMIDSDPEFSYSANLLYMITGEEPSALQEKAMDVSLILWAEQEIDASTLAARVVTSTQSDIYSAVVAALGTLKGPLLGGAAEDVFHTLMGHADPLDEWVREVLAAETPMAGFGHGANGEADPRAAILQQYCTELADEAGNFSLEESAEVIERIVWEEERLPPRLEWPSARLYRYLGMDSGLYVPMLAVGRASGWCAHVIEQTQDNQPIHHASRYIGSGPRAYEPVSERG
ncbi:MAG: citrate synthase [Planctomycetaceae bacterium]|nr:citrate synthase [Planctomycetaceae bacterium]